MTLRESGGTHEEWEVRERDGNDVIQFAFGNSQKWHLPPKKW